LHEVEGLKIGMDVIKSFRNCQPISEFFWPRIFRESERVQFFDNIFRAIHFGLVKFASNSLVHENLAFNFFRK